MKEGYRIDKQQRTNLWRVKEAPGWKIVFKHADLAACAGWLRERGADPAGVVVVHEWPWRSLGELLKLTHQPRALPANLVGYTCRVPKLNGRGYWWATIIENHASPNYVKVKGGRSFGAARWVHLNDLKDIRRPEDGE